MIKQTLTNTEYWQSNGLVTIRIITGILMFYHGLEVFKPETMKSYLEWDMIKALPFPVFMVYLGKSLELISGLFLFLGLFTRVSSFFMALNMLFICFYIGNGKFYYEDQHPFLFALLALVFLFKGSIKFGLDNYFFKK
jgi:putative oxidoreductase